MSFSDPDIFGVVGGSSPDLTCFVDGDGADQGELTGGGMKLMGGYDD